MAALAGYQLLPPAELNRPNRCEPLPAESLLLMFGAVAPYLYADAPVLRSAGDGGFPLRNRDAGLSARLGHLAADRRFAGCGSLVASRVRRTSTPRGG